MRVDSVPRLVMGTEYHPDFQLINWLKY